jgi:mycoredoxin
MSDATPDTPSALETPDLQDLPVPTPAAGSVTMFTTSWCGYCRRLRSQLERDGVPFTEIDIEARPEHVDFVEEVNGGNRTVPTVLFPDGSAATNPSLAEVRARLGP